MDDETKYVWRMWGKWYGYPDCCVDNLYIRNKYN